jgi:transketolase
MNERAMTEAYGEVLVELAKENRDIVVLDADLGIHVGIQPFAEAFPERYFTVGIAEQNIVGIAAGLAAYGKIPFANTFACFFEKAYEQIRIAVAYTKLNVKIVGTHSGIATGPDGATHEALEDIAIFRALPNMTLISPGDYIEAAKAVRAIVEHKGPVYLRFTRPALPAIFDKSYGFQIGRAVTLRDGSDATIMATGIMVSEALETAKSLAKEGLDVRVVDVSTIKPIDEGAIVKAASETGAIVTAEDHSIIGGLGSAVSEVLGEHKPAYIERVGVKDAFGKSGRTEELFEIYGLTALDIAKAVNRVLERKRHNGEVASNKLHQ